MAKKTAKVQIERLEKALRIRSEEIETILSISEEELDIIRKFNNSESLKHISQFPQEYINSVKELGHYKDKEAIDNAKKLFFIYSTIVDLETRENAYKESVSYHTLEAIEEGMGEDLARAVADAVIAKKGKIEASFKSETGVTIKEFIDYVEKASSERGKATTEAEAVTEK